MSMTIKVGENDGPAGTLTRACACLYILIQIFNVIHLYDVFENIIVSCWFFKVITIFIPCDCQAIRGDGKMQLSVYQFLEINP